MKYMGHKGRILKAIRAQVARFTKGANILCDPFCGSSVVAWDLAEQFDRPILAGDLQRFAAARAAAIITRTEPIADLGFVDRWFARAQQKVEDATARSRIPRTPDVASKDEYRRPRRAVLCARAYVEKTLAPSLEHTTHSWPITTAYAGYYFSIDQSLSLDALRSTLPKRPDVRALALAALIGAASRCSASPGHTAQPLGISKTSLPHVIDAWNRPLLNYVRDEVQKIAPRHAKVMGQVQVGSWETLLEQLYPGDVVFCDPPYSDVQYSRFYHVLETLSRGHDVSVSGSGRNPPFSERPASDFSRRSKARDEVEKLMYMASALRLRLVITFPVTRQSNGLAALTFARKARKYFRSVDNLEIESIFSSLGGNGTNGHRPARQGRIERIICCSQ